MDVDVNIPSQDSSSTLHIFLPASNIRLAQDVRSRITVWDILILLITSSGTLLWLLRSYRSTKNPYHDFFYDVPQGKEVAKDKQHVTSRNIVERMRELVGGRPPESEKSSV